MPRQFPTDFYIFLTPKDDLESNSRIMIMDTESPFAGMIFVIHHIKLSQHPITRKYSLDFNYDIVEHPNEGEVDPKNPEVTELIGDIIMDVWEKYYA